MKFEKSGGNENLEKRKKNSLFVFAPLLSSKKKKKLKKILGLLLAPRRPLPHPFLPRRPQQRPRLPRLAGPARQALPLPEALAGAADLRPGEAPELHPPPLRAGFVALGPYPGGGGGRRGRRPVRARSAAEARPGVLPGGRREGPVGGVVVVVVKEDRRTRREGQRPRQDRPQLDRSRKRGSSELLRREDGDRREQHDGQQRGAGVEGAGGGGAGLEGGVSE